jgi:alpha-tubulin suppressor-like RCC1 family protein
MRTDNHTGTLLAILLTTLLSLPAWHNTLAQEGREHTLYICADSTVRAFGYNHSCQLGSNQPNASYSPVVVPGLQRVVAVAVGHSHSLAISDDGSVWAWGSNSAGCSGQPASTSSFCSPTVVELPGCAVAVAAGLSFSIALLADSTVWAWGLDNVGQLGNGAGNSTSHIPVQAASISSAIAISAGSEHAMALLANGTVWTWGNGLDGRLGNGGTSNSFAPVQVLIAASTPLTDVVKIDAGGRHCIVLRENNTVYTWGDNEYGQLGLGNYADATYATSSSGLSSGIEIDVAAGLVHSMVLRINGATRVCGSNDRSQLGLMSPFSAPWPTNPIAGPTISGAVDIITPSSAQHGWAITSTGQVYTWGDNNHGAAGVITSPPNEVYPPTLVNGSGSDNQCSAMPTVDNHPQPCCVAVYEDERTVIGTNGGTVTLTGTQTFTGLNMAIFGTVILNGNRTFNNCDVVMGKDAKIIVNGTRTLNIHTNSHFYACGDMWDGIIVNNNGRVYVQSGSIIEDAEIAVDVKYGALYSLNNATFNRNYIHVKKTMPPSGTPQLILDYYIVKCKFFCHTTPAGTTPDVLLPPRAGQRTNVAIHAVGVPKILVGSTLANANTFDNTDFGIFTDGVSRVEARFNTLRDITYVGISCLDGPGTGTETVAISRNTLQRMPTGIYCYDNPKATVKIDTNTITFAGMMAPPQVMTGIRYEEIVPGNSTFPNKLRIMGNNIQHAPCGIHLMNLYGTFVGSSTTYVGENTITHTKIPNDAQSGILMQNVSGVNVKANNVSHPTNAVNWWETGIRCSGTTNWFFCNNTHHVGNGLFFDNDNRPSTMLVQDTMDHNGTGIFLNWAIIGAQGNTAGDPNDNIWTTATAWSSSNPHILSYGAGADGFQSPFHVQSPGPQYFPTHRAVAGGIQVPTPTTTAKFWTAGCLFNPPNYKVEEENPALAEALQMVSEAEDAQPQTERERSIRWNGQFGLYRQLLENEEFRHSEESLIAYFLEKDGSNMGRLYRAMGEFQALRSGIMDGTTSDNLTMVGTIVSDHLPEQRLAEVLGMLHADMADPGTMDDATEARLRDIAIMCPLDEGFAVYIARAALQSLDSLPQHYFSECEAVPAPEKHKTELEQNTQPMFWTYPNPSNGMLQVDYVLGHGESGTLNVFSIVGQRLLQRQLDPSQTHLSLDLGNIDHGTYLLRVDVNGEQRLIQKINIIR